MNITVVGTGYVGFPMACILAQRHNVVALDIDQGKVDRINNRHSPVHDQGIDEFLKKTSLRLRATTYADQAFQNSDFVIIAVPTNYDADAGKFDMAPVMDVLDQVAKSGAEPIVVIKSTVPIGFCNEAAAAFPGLTILFSPEFLREGRALSDNFHPSRIVVGGDPEQAAAFADLLREASLDKDVPVIITGRSEAEAIKLFANSYLAMRVAFFNELDSFAASKGYDARNIIAGVCADPRIGDGYNNPSFGYGGYCLPKDTKQIVASFEDIPQEIFGAIVRANGVRKRFVADQILAMKKTPVGIHRLSMKQGSDNFRDASILDVVHLLKSNGVEVIVYEPELLEDQFMGCPVVRKIDEFIERSGLIVANRVGEDLKVAQHKIYTRDLFGIN